MGKRERVVSLRFDRRFVAPIRAGEKTTTLRKSRWGLPAVGDLVDARYGLGYTFATLRVTRSEPISLHRITIHDARTDGFADVEALKETLGRIYPGESEFVRLTFELTDRAPKVGG